MANVLVDSDILIHHLRGLESMTDISVDAAVAERAGRLRRTTPVRLPDALIAATASEHRLVLLTSCSSRRWTRNQRSFVTDDRSSSSKRRLEGACEIDGGLWLR